MLFEGVQLQSQKFFEHFIGKAGLIQTVITVPSNKPDGLVFITHPHPLFGGSMDNKVVTTIDKAYLAKNFATVKFNFRGVGSSEGHFDNGIGETEDFLLLFDQIMEFQPIQSKLKGEDTLISFAGFSFGTYVISRALLKKPVDFALLIGTAPNKWDYPDIKQNFTAIHGELDDVVPLPDVLSWMNKQEKPLIVIPGSNHFFDRKLNLLKQTISLNINSHHG